MGIKKERDRRTQLEQGKSQKSRLSDGELMFGKVVTLWLYYELFYKNIFLIKIGMIFIYI